jgi:hypothetical protein
MKKVGSVSVVEVGRGTGACVDGAGGRRRWGSGREQLSIGVGGVLPVELKQKTFWANSA